MNVVRITCGVALLCLAVAMAGWAVQSRSGPPPAGTQAEWAPQQSPGLASRRDERAGRRRLELTEGLGGFRMPCRDCHRGLGSPSEDPVGRGHGPHEAVVLQHGQNNRCFNCHHPDPEQYGSFVAHDGSVIPLDEVERLCAKCHGPHYRDWQHGVHGLRTGYWDPRRGPQEAVACNGCHDPHQPYFKPIPTLPAPRSLQGELLPDHPCWKGH